MSQHSSRKASGLVISNPIDSDREIQRDTCHCVHCGYTWMVQPGSGKRRGYCMSCGGFVCGRQCCVSRGCVSKEQQLENMEKGLPLDHKPISILVPGTVKGE